jgi:transglutaminase-like putative cysteine protease
MQKSLMLILSVLSFVLAANAQIKRFKFGDIDKSVLAMKETAIEKDAAAVVVFNTAKLYCYSFGNPFSTDYEAHKCIKILNSKGLKEADIKIYIPSSKSEGSIKKLRAQTYNLDDNGEMQIAKVDEASITQKKVNDRFSEVSFSFPNVKAGSVLEFSYTFKSNDMELPNFVFQESIPTMYSGYEINFPENLIVRGLFTGIYIPKEKNELQSARRISTYELEDAIAVTKEPFMTSVNDYITTVNPILSHYVTSLGAKENLQYNWLEIVDDLVTHHSFGVQLKKDLPATGALADSLKLLTKPYDKMKTIYHYVQNNMEWDGYNSLYASSGVKEAWRDKKGNAGEINLILINLLKDAKLDARPLLLSTYDNGFVNIDYVNRYQFNKVLAYVLIDDEVYILDGTNKFAAVEDVPRNVAFTEGIVINKLSKGGWGWIRAHKPKVIYEQMINTFASIGKDILKGKTTIVSKNFAKSERIEAYKKSSTDYISYYYVPKDGLTIKESKVNNTYNDNKPLVEEIEFESKLNTTGEYAYFSLNILTGKEKNIFASPTRNSDILFGYNQSFSYSGLISIDENNYEFDELPKNKKLISPDSSIIVRRVLEKQGNNLNYLFEINYKQPYYPASNYPVFFEVQKLLFQILEEQIVLKKVKK